MITVNKNEFLNAIRAVKTSCGKANIMPILSTLHLKTLGQALQLTATDTIFSARTIIAANVTEQREFCINADKLENIVNALDDIITIDCPENVAIIKSGNTHFDVLILNTEDYPHPNFDLSDDKVVLSKDDFIKGVNKTTISTTIDNQLLSGVCFTFDKENGYEMAATDGNRLSLVKFNDIEVDKEGQFVIPHTVLNNVIKCANSDIEIYFKDNRAIFKTDNYVYSSNILSGKYPMYAKLIPQEHSILAVIDKAELLKSLEKVAIMSDSRTNVTVFDFKDNNLHLTTSCESGKAEDTIPVNCNGELKIAFNFRFVLEGIKAMQSNEIQFGMNDEKSAVVVKGDFIYLIMPIMTKG